MVLVRGGRFWDVVAYRWRKGGGVNKLPGAVGAASPQPVAPGPNGGPLNAAGGLRNAPVPLRSGAAWAWKPRSVVGRGGGLGEETPLQMNVPLRIYYLYITATQIYNSKAFGVTEEIGGAGIEGWGMVGGTDPYIKF